MEDARRQLNTRRDTIRRARLRSSSRGLMARSNFPPTGAKSIRIRHRSSLAGVPSRMNAEAQCTFVNGYPDGIVKSHMSTGHFLAKRKQLRVAKVQVSHHPSSSSCALVSGKFGWLANMERIMEAPTLVDTISMEYMHGRRILEI
eukprot:Gb_14710 [translate_table: standard]